MLSKADCMFSKRGLKALKMVYSRLCKVATRACGLSPSLCFAIAFLSEFAESCCCLPSPMLCYRALNPVY